MKRLLLVIILITSAGWAEEWNRFRGPNGSGVSSATGMPVEFGPAKNMAWRSEVPFGRSSPILTAKCVVVTGSEGQKLITLCLDRATGKALWRQEIVRDRTQKVYKGNDTATPTAASDGSNIYVFFPDFGLVSFGPNGKERWRLKLGPFDNFYGMAASPILHGNTLVQVCDQKQGSFILAVDKNSGRTRWRKERKEANIGYSTPIIWKPEKGKPQVIVSGTYRIDAYALDTGENIWWVGKQGTSPISTPAMENGIVFSTSYGSDKPPYEPWEKFAAPIDKNNDGKLSPEEVKAIPEFGDHFGFIDRNNDGFVTSTEWDEMLKESMSEYGLVAVRAGGSGDQTEKSILWRNKKDFSSLTSPLVYRGVLYTVKDGGIVSSLNPATGEAFKTERTKDAIGSYFASPVAAEGKVYLISNDGKVSVLKADAKWEVLTVNDLGEECQTTPAIDNGSIYIRTAKALYRFGQKR